jgi:hypothetical protein
MFLQEFSMFLEERLLSPGYLLICGDFNIHVDQPDIPDTVKCNDLIQSLNLTQHVQHLTHRSGHTLDLVITCANEAPIDNIKVIDSAISDHFSVMFTSDMMKSKPLKREIVYRKVKDIVVQDFRTDLTASKLLTAPASDVTDHMLQYNSVLTELMDTHAPFKKRSVSLRTTVPLYNEEIKSAKKGRQKAEKKWRNTGLTIHREIYCNQRNNVNKLINEAKLEYYSTKINDKPSDQRSLFKWANELLNQNRASPLPSDVSDQILSDKMATYFVQKIKKIRDELQHVRQTVVTPDLDESIDFPEETLLTHFMPATESEIRKIIKSSPSKSCSLDPLPTTLLKSCLDDLLPTLTAIVNKSLASSTVPDIMKKAVIVPILKKANLDPENLKNYRPISNLSFVSKILEKVVANRLNMHLETNNLNEPMQSAYRKFHSTETALLKVQNDILRAVDDQQCVLLVLLDLSAAFDTVDHTVLLNRLTNTFGICGDALQWVKSYLAKRKKTVTINGTSSEEHVSECDVPQGSVLGPGLFKKYSHPLGKLVRTFGLNLHLYADDTQLYLSFTKSSEDSAVGKMEDCIGAVRAWMATNYLKLNDDKTEFIVLGSSAQLSKLSQKEMHIGDTIVTPSDKVRNIGAIFDSCMKLDKQVAGQCKSAWYNLYRISRIRKYLNRNQTKTLIHALVTSKLDHHNSLLYGIPKYQTDKLQRIQNASARIIAKTQKQDHITPVLKELHWLPVTERIVYKTLLLTFKCLNAEGPTYLEELLQHHTPSRSLRSSSALLLEVPHIKLTTYGARAFSYVAPVLWNALPPSLRQCKNTDGFKEDLKTYLFRKVYCVND